jgi:hypothetical protein
VCESVRGIGRETERGGRERERITKVESDMERERGREGGGIERDGGREEVDKERGRIRGK